MVTQHKRSLHVDEPRSLGLSMHALIRTGQSLTIDQALGCAPAVKGYLLAMQEVCHAHGALFVLDEIMCGMGRTGKHLHAFLHHEGVRPDILVIGKALGAGCMPVSAMLCSQAIIDVLGDESFNHGYTFQNHPPSCTAALEVLKIIEEYNLLENVDRQGKYLQQLMCEKIERLPHVSPIRGQGFFQGVSKNMVLAIFSDNFTVQLGKRQGYEDIIRPKASRGSSNTRKGQVQAYCVTSSFHTNTSDRLEGPKIRNLRLLWHGKRRRRS